MLEYVYVSGIRKKEFQWDDPWYTENIKTLKKFFRDNKLKMVAVVIKETIDGEKNKEINTWTSLKYYWDEKSEIDIILENKSVGKYWGDRDLYLVRACKE